MATEYNVGMLVYSSVSLFDAEVQDAVYVFAALQSGIGRFYPEAVFIETTDLEALASAGVVSIGTNHPDYDNILVNVEIPPSSTIDQLRVIQISGLVPSLDEGALVKVRIRVPTVAGEHLFKAGIAGYHAG